MKVSLSESNKATLGSEFEADLEEESPMEKKGKEYMKFYPGCEPDDNVEMVVMNLEQIERIKRNLSNFYKKSH